MNDSGDPLEPPRHHQTPTNLPQPVDVPRLGVTTEFRALMEFLADRAPWPHSETFRELAIDWTATARDEAA